MDIVKDSVLATIIGGMFYIIGSNAGSFCIKGMEDDKLLANQYNVAIMFSAAIFGFLLAFIIFNKTKLANRAIKFGLIIGSILLLFDSTVRNYHVISDEYKLVLFSILFGLVLYIAFKYRS